MTRAGQGQHSAPCVSGTVCGPIPIKCKYSIYLIHCASSQSSRRSHLRVRRPWLQRQ